MGLSCECDVDWYPEPGDWFFTGTNKEYLPFPFKRKRKCCSCKTLIDVGALSLSHHRVRVPETDIEIRIYGEDGEIPIASVWMCEGCGDLYLSLTELGYCMSPYEDMRELVKQYADEHHA